MAEGASASRDSDVVPLMSEVDVARYRREAEDCRSRAPEDQKLSVGTGAFLKRSHLVPVYQNFSEPCLRIVGGRPKRQRPRASVHFYTETRREYHLPRPARRLRNVARAPPVFRLAGCFSHTDGHRMTRAMTLRFFLLVAVATLAWTSFLIWMMWRLLFA